MRRMVLGVWLLIALTVWADPAAAFDWIGKVELDAEGLKSPDSQKRYDAIRKLQQYDELVVRSYFLGALRDPDERVRSLAGRWLGKHHVTAAVPAIVEWLNEPDNQIKQIAAEILGQLGGPKAVKALIRSLGDIDPQVRLRTVYALGKIGSPRVVVPLVGRLEDDKSDVRKAAIAELLKIGDRRAVIPLVGAFNDPSIKVRALAVAAVGHLGDPAPIPALLRLVRDPVDAIKISAVGALGNLHADEAADVLVDRLKVGGSAKLRAKLAYSLGQLAKTTKSEKRRQLIVSALVKALAKSRDRVAAREALLNAGAVAVPSLIASLDGALPGDPKTVVSLLTEIGDPRATTALIAELDRGRLDTKLILDGLAKTGDRRAVVPVLGQLSSSDPRLRLQAMTALRALLVHGGDARASDVLVGLLGDKDAAIQRLAIEYLGLMRARGAVPKLLALAGPSTSTSLRRAAVVALGEIADSRAAPLMLQVLRRGPRSLETIAANSLMHMGGASVATRLLAIVRNPRSRSRGQAVRALGGVLRDRKHAAARRLLEQLAVDAEGPLGIASINALGAMRRPQSSAVLLRIAVSVDAGRRRAALEAIGNLGDATHASVLLRALRSRDDRVSSAAAWALAKLEVPGALPALFRATRRQGWATAINASAAVARYAHVDRLDQILPLLHHRVRLVRVNAAKVAGRLGAVPARRTLIKMLEHDPSWLVRVAAARALGQIGGARKSLETAAKKDPHEQVQRAAKTAITSAFKAPSRSDWRDFHFIDPANGDVEVRQEPYFIVASDGLATALYTDSRGRAGEERFPPGPYTIAPKARATRY